MNPRKQRALLMTVVAIVALAINQPSERSSSSVAYQATALG